ncbi:MAG: tyrosine-type recombinase/integrase [Candidatus Korobacteraceae bacterium]
MHKTERLCSINGEQHHRFCEKKTEHRTKKSVCDVRGKIMQTVNASQSSAQPQQDMSVLDFWEQRYLPYCEEIVQLTGKARKKPSTVRGYRQIWKQHLKAHFGRITLQAYEPYMGTRFLQSLTGTQGKNTLKHIKALGSSLFKRAVIEQRIKVNPWHDVSMPDDAIESRPTKHYTLEEAENIISALVDHVDCQLVMALSCFLALRPGEIAALRWEDFDPGNVHIRRSVVRGIVDTPKTPESVASVPLIEPVKIPLELWRQKCGDRREGYVFESRNGTPVDLHNLIDRVIKPHVEGKRRCESCDKVPRKIGTWKTLYAGRRGACTAVIENTGGNYAVAQALLRHKSMLTTLRVYKKAITPEAFRSGMKLREAAATNGKDG